jgi:acetylornithine deacetylase/succinyl-diaminopimelate desuccinylase-like protein
MSDATSVLQHIAQDFDQAVGRYVEFLRIPSISPHPAHAVDVRRAGQWLLDQLTGLGFEAVLHDTPGHPVLIAHHPGPGRGVGPHQLYNGDEQGRE